MHLPFKINKDTISENETKYFYNLLSILLLVFFQFIECIFIKRIIARNHSIDFNLSNNTNMQSINQLCALIIILLFFVSDVKIIHSSALGLNNTNPSNGSNASSKIASTGKSSYILTYFRNI